MSLAELKMAVTQMEHGQFSHPEKLDHFEFDDDGPFAFPCVICTHRGTDLKEAPCVGCRHFD